VSPRPALGWNGLTAAAEIDPFIQQNLLNGKIAEVNQTSYLKTHSGMQVPTERIRTEVYEKVIMNHYIKPHTGFGKY